MSASAAPSDGDATAPFGLRCLLTSSPLSLADASAFVSSPFAGATSVFLGVTRNNHGGRSVARLEYEANEPLALRTLRDIAREAAERWRVAAPASPGLKRCCDPPASSDHAGAALAAPSEPRLGSACELAASDVEASSAAGVPPAAHSSHAELPPPPPPSGILSIYVAHRLGEVPVSESSVIIAVSSAHRAEGLAATAYIIDELKARAAIWKKEVYVDGSAGWKENVECSWGQT